MPDEKEFDKYKWKHQKDLERRIRQLEIDYARDINNFESQIRAINEATKSFPTKEEVERRLQALEKMDIHNIPKEVETLKQYQQRMEGKMMAYSSGIAFLVSLASIILYIVFL